MKDLVLMRLTKGRRQYDARSILNVAEYVFKELRDADPLKDWMVTWIAKNFRDVSLTGSLAFWRVMDADSELKVRVFEKTAEVVRGLVKVKSGIDGEGARNGE